MMIQTFFINQLTDVFNLVTGSNFDYIIIQFNSSDYI